MHKMSHKVRQLIKNCKENNTSVHLLYIRTMQLQFPHLREVRIVLQTFKACTWSFLILSCLPLKLHPSG